MTAEELQAIRERAEATTPEPWTARPKILSTRGETECEIVGNVGFGYSTPVCKLYSGFYRYEQDKVFITHAHADIHALLAEVERLQALNEGESGQFAGVIELAMAQIKQLQAENDNLRQRVETADRLLSRAIAQRDGPDKLDDLEFLGGA